ncbi:MAG: ATP-binding cassette domain-containing protein [Nocardioides sp.]|uniref:ABC transporter permease subunit n=1 Tax=Nocardioides sp. TaxID=35761 RepID=UPI00239BAC43|nr:ATP-binding cassette domain-containing protein [Nocardioides sp.]MDE0778387.1 ATP-binding cassette domain-containing protein [Nocardioides sp.]
MDEALTFVVVGIAGGSTYALLALGLVLVHSVSRVLNFAQGAFGTLAAFVAASIAIGHDLPWPLAVIAAVLVGGAVGAATAWVLLGRDGGILPPLVGTVGLLSAATLVEARWLGGTREFPTPVDGDGLELAGVVITPTRILVVSVAATAGLLLWLGLERTRIGLALRAGADNRDGARIVGLDPRRLEVAAWSAAGVLGALAGVLSGWTSQTITPGFLTGVLPQAFAGAMLGGMVSLPGAILGGLVIGVAESLTRLYWGDAPGSPELVVFLVLGAVLLLRPQGLFTRARRELAAEGSESLVRLLPMLRDPRPRRASSVATSMGAPVLAAVAAVVLAGAVSGPDAFKLSALPVYAVLALSVNFLASATGQLSLGHAGLFGLGAFGTAIATTSWELSPLLGFVAGPALAGVVAAALGAASLRVRGLYLAVLTLAFGVVLQAFVFPTRTFSRGGAGLTVSRPELGPFDLGDDGTFLVACILVLIAVWVVLRRLERVPLLRGMVAIRENQTAAAARGIDSIRLGIAGFAISGVLAGLAGATFAVRQGIVVASVFPVQLSLTLVIWVVLGGLGSRWGVVAVTAAFTLVDLYASGSNQLVTLSAAMGVVLMIGRHPLGAGGAVRSLIERKRGAVSAVAGVEDPDVEDPDVEDPVEASGATMPAGSTASAWSGVPPTVRFPDGALVRPVLLAARDITVRFGGNVAIDSLSLDVHPGEIIGVLGPNGAGKTTAFNVFSGFVQPLGGEVWFRGQDVSGLSPAERTRRGLGRSFQQGGLWPSETAHSNLLMAQYARGTGVGFGDVVSAAPAQARIDRRRAGVADEVLEVLGLGYAARRPVSTLPYGHRKILEIGCAVATGPVLILLDEPAAGLHGAQSEWVAQAIAALRRELGITVVLIEHDVGLVREVSDRIYALDFGRLLAEGLPDEVLAQPEVIEAYLGQGTAPDAGEAVAR